MIDEHTEELACAYVLGALESDAGREFERQLAQDAELRGLVAGLRELTLLIGGNTELIEPSPALRTRLMMDFGDRSPMLGNGPVSGRGSLWQSRILPWALAAGLAGLCLLFGVQVHALRQQLQARQQRMQDLTQLIGSLREDASSLRQTVVSLQQSNRLANMRIAVLSAQLRTDPKAVAVSVWDNDRQSGVVVVRHLKPPPPGKDYQLWIIDPHYRQPVDAGVLRVDAAGDGRVDFSARRPIQQPERFAVTVEIKGGSPVPTPKSTVLAGA